MTLRGRAASPIRVGFIIKAALQGNLPLRSGELAHEAAIADLFGAYKSELERVNALRTKPKRIHGMRWASFYTVFRFAKVLGLVEFVREEPMIYPPPGGDLLRVEKGDNGHPKVVKSTRKIFRLSSAGGVDEKCWSDLTRAFKESWTPGQPLAEGPAPSIVPPVRRRAPKVTEEPVVGFRPFAWEEVPSVNKFRSLLKHLNILRSLGYDYPGVNEEIERLSMAIGDWIMDAEDSLESAKSLNATTKIKMYSTRLKLLKGLSDTLGEGTVAEAMEMLSSLIKEEAV